MALQTIDPLSGYVPVNLNEGGWDKNVKKVEVDNYQIAIYYEKVSTYNVLLRLASIYLNRN